MNDETPKLKKLRKAMQKACKKHRRKLRQYEAAVEAVFTLRFFFSQGDEMKAKDRLICRATDALEASNDGLLKELAKTKKRSEAAHEAYWKAYRAHMASKRSNSND